MNDDAAFEVEFDDPVSITKSEGIMGALNRAIQKSPQPNETEILESSREAMSDQYPSRVMTTMTAQRGMHNSTISYCNQRQGMLIKLRKLFTIIKADMQDYVMDEDSGDVVVNTARAKTTDALIFKTDANGQNLLDIMLDGRRRDNADETFKSSVDFEPVSIPKQRVARSNKVSSK